MSRLRRLLGVAAVGSVLATAGPAFAAGPLGPDGAPIATSNYKVDLSHGVVLAGSRVLGLAGAYVAIAEGFDGSAQTAAAPAVRLPHSFDHVDYDIGLGLTFPASVRGNDLFNSGEKTQLSRSQEDALFVDLGGQLQLGRWGIGLLVDTTRFELAPKGQDLGLAARFGGATLQLARSWHDGQLITGFGSRGTGMVIENRNPQPGEPDVLFDIQGAAIELGALWRPNGERFRVGFALRSPVITNKLSTDVERDTAGDRVLTRGGTNLYLPEAVGLPGDLNLGVAVQLGPRPFNPRWVDPDRALDRLDRYLRWREAERARQRRERLARARNEGRDPEPVAKADLAEQSTLATLDALHRQRVERAIRDELRRRYRAMHRQYLLLSASVLITSPMDDAVGVESFLEGQVQRSGERVTIAPHLGAESELISDWLKLRAGSYWEPTRFRSRGARPRLHGTFGLDQKLFPWSVFGVFDEDTEWRAGGAIDVARDYLSWGVSLGLWH